MPHNHVAYHFTQFNLPGSDRTVERYYKFVTLPGGHKKSVWVNKEEAVQHGATERGAPRTMRPTVRAERLEESKYVGYITSLVGTKRKGCTRTMTQAVGKDGKLYKANKDEALKTGLPIHPKVQGLQTWYIHSGKKHQSSQIREIQREFHRRHKIHQKQRKAGRLSYALETYTLGAPVGGGITSDDEMLTKGSTCGARHPLRYADAVDGDLGSGSNSDFDPDPDPYVFHGSNRADDERVNASNREIHVDHSSDKISQQRSVRRNFNDSFNDTSRGRSSNGVPNISRTVRTVRTMRERELTRSLPRTRTRTQRIRRISSSSPLPSPSSSSSSNARRSVGDVSERVSRREAPRVR
jgi:hypothetical protein